MAALEVILMRRRTSLIANCFADRTVISVESLNFGFDDKILPTTTATEGVAECEIDGGNLMPQVFLFLAQIIAGIGHTLCGTLGISYMDDNIKKSKTPALMSK